MDDEHEDALIESELRSLRPAAVSGRLEAGISRQIGAPDLPAPRAAWWRRLGFARPAAAVGWGLFSPAAAAAIALIAVRASGGKPLPSPPVSHVQTAGESTVRSAQAIPYRTADNARAATVLDGAYDEGVMPDGGNGIVRRVRYRSTDHVQWRNPRTGAEWEVSYPREDVLLVPVNAE